jgi:hypothetical protein
MILFYILEQRGLTFEASIRGIRLWFLGVKRPALSRRSIRHWIDYG